MLYQAYEFAHAAIAPWRSAAKISRKMLSDRHNPWSRSLGGRSAAAAFQMFENATKRYGKPDFGIERSIVNGQPAAILEEVEISKPFCDLRRFRRYGPGVRWGEDPKVLLVAPMSGHFATLLRDTVETLLPDHSVYITDWRDARDVPLSEGDFDLNDYIDYLIEFLHHMGPGVTLYAVCQPGPAALAATALMAQDNDPCRPSSLILTGSPIDTRVSPTEPTRLAEKRPLSWFKNNALAHVPWPNMGMMRQVYPGFLQLSGFMSMNMDRHMDAHIRHFEHLVQGDGDSAVAHRKFYDEYLSVMDLTAEFYLQTVDEVFQRHLLPKGEFTHRGRRVRPEAITDTALMTIEGGKDDITGAGQAHAAHALCPNLPDDMKLEYTHPDVGHYGQFNGRRWRAEIYPIARDFIKKHRRVEEAPALEHEEA